MQNDSELDELRTLLSGFEDASHELGITAIMLATKGDTPKQDGEIIQVPGKRQGKVTPRMAHVVKLGSNCPSLKRTIRRIESTPEMVKTVVLRLATEARYHDESKWKAILEHSSHAAHKWLHSNLPAVMQRKVRDTWGWQLESSKGGGKALVTAMVRVEHTAVNSMLSLSGKESWFIEPLRWDQPDVPACEVKWVKGTPKSRDLSMHTEYMQRLGTLELPGVGKASVFVCLGDLRQEARPVPKHGGSLGFQVIGATSQSSQNFRQLACPTCS